MEGKTPSQMKARLIVLAVFVIGFVGGALAMNLYKSTTNPQGPKGPGRNGGGGKPPQHFILKKMTDRLHLTQEQQDGIKAILDETFEGYANIRKDIEPRMNSVRQQGRERMRALLTPEQLPEYEKMIEESNRRREESREKNKK